MTYAATARRLNSKPSSSTPPSAYHQTFDAVEEVGHFGTAKEAYAAAVARIALKGDPDRWRPTALSF